MSYITEHVLWTALNGLYKEVHGKEPDQLTVSEIHRQRVRFRANIDGRMIEFGIPEDDLSSMHIGDVTKRYLRPLLTEK